MPNHSEIYFTEDRNVELNHPYITFTNDKPCSEEIHTSVHETIGPEEGGSGLSELSTQQITPNPNSSSEFDDYVCSSHEPQNSSILAPPETDEYEYIDSKPTQNDSGMPTATPRPTLAEKRRNLSPTTFDSDRVIRAKSAIYDYATESDAPQPNTNKCSANTTILKRLAIPAVVIVIVGLAVILTRLTSKNKTEMDIGMSCHNLYSKCGVFI